MDQPAAPIASPPPAAVPQPAPYVPPQPAPYVPPAAPPAESMGEGGLFKNLDWVQTGFLILGAFAIFHIIDYYRRKVKEDKANQATVADLSQSVEKLQMNFDGLMKRIRTRRQ